MAFQRCLQIRPDDATLLNNTALSLMQAGDYTGAEPLYRRALAINEKALGPDHPYVATNLNNLAFLLYDKGDYAGAEPLYRRALAIDEKALGPDDPGVAQQASTTWPRCFDQKATTRQPCRFTGGLWRLTRKR